MRLLTVTHFFEAHGGGIERVAGQLCREFVTQGQEAIWAASDRDVLPCDGIIPLPLRCIDPAERLSGLPMPLPSFGAARNLADEIGKCDAVIIHDALYVTSILAMVIAIRRGKRTVLIQHISKIPFSSRLLRLTMALANQLVTRLMMRAADELVFISDTVREDLLGSKPWRDYRLIFNGVDPAIFHPISGDNGTSRAHVQWPPGKTRILFVGRYVEKKGLAVIRALAELRSDLSFLLAGSGPFRPSDWGVG
ncbi:glycosyltransferase [Novosphingobium sp. G106]|uniref:glycosyltransferase n=1 Tax=Novosphingobium sp. G106 TaxID=2849500 RepID=UPI001C2DDE67|nr:glycosyltransferase [Novosphingobium sp. G106]MBV1689339.1 glycosyltransferase [Novosphingobium sp. G106]